MYSIGQSKRFAPIKPAYETFIYAATRIFIFDHRLTVFVFIGVMSRITRAPTRQTIILDLRGASQSTSERQSFHSASPTIRATSTTRTCQPQTYNIPSQSRVAEKDSLRVVSGNRAGTRKRHQAWLHIAPSRTERVQWFPFQWIQSAYSLTISTRL